MSTQPEDDYEPSGSSGSESDRPNRWDGPPSTWQDMNREEINTLTSLEEIKNRDLSLHLYNAFALKERRQGSEENQWPSPDMVNTSVKSFETLEPTYAC